MDAVANSPESSKVTFGASVKRYTANVTNVAAINASQSGSRKKGADSALNKVAPVGSSSGSGRDSGVGEGAGLGAFGCATGLGTEILRTFLRLPLLI
jgi:hypothetical protein